MMTTFHKKNYIKGKVVSFTKGAPDVIIKRCKYINIKWRNKRFGRIFKKKALDTNSFLSKDALRVWALSYREYNILPKDISSR